MSVASLIRAGERLPLPDLVTRAAIGFLVGRTGRKLAAAEPGREAAFAAGMDDVPTAEHAEAANAQHHELPAAFFAEILGPRRKHSCCLYASASTKPAEAEEAALAETCAHADLRNGQAVLELGCGWGSLSLWMAERYPASRITSVSSSRSQGEHIERRARALGLANLTVVTADMNAFVAPDPYDRIVSVEMFEHMANWGALLRRVRDWLAPDGRLFLHVVSHAGAPYRLDSRDGADWIAQHFFPGGIMPSHGLIRQFDRVFEVEEEWRWNGTHYARTARDWLTRFDRNIAAIRPILREVYGRDAGLWERRWRLLFLATEGLFGYRGGESWAVSHYRLRRATA